jgi:hypothetical protein
MGLSLLISFGVLAGLLFSLGGTAAAFGGLSWMTAQDQGSPTPAPTPRTAASNVQAFYQGDPNAGWDSSEQFKIWWQSACSPAVLTMALRAWGLPIHIGQVLDRLIALNAIKPQNGLLHAEALGTIAQDYGFQATTFWRWTLQDLAQVTNQGVPVLVDVVDAKQQTPYPGFSGGHWLVVMAVSSDHVQVSDSSGYHIHSLSLALFQTLFTGIGVVVWQGASISLP